MDWSDRFASARRCGGGPVHPELARGLRADPGSEPRRRDPEIPAPGADGVRPSHPLHGYPAVAAGHAGWHAREVFRGPSCAA
ncbi:MAG: hypothetical protein ACYCO9_20320 [Streptosporangiaceae bacterium]